MMAGMKQILLRLLLIGAGIAYAPVIVIAQEEESKIYDARLEGYGGTVTLQNSSTALMWLLLVVLAALCVGVMFKNAKRTHLD